MPREIYSLTDATRETLTDQVKAMAAAWSKSDKYIYAILSEDKTDPFAPFVAMYRAVLRGGLSTTLFDAELAFERSRYQPQRRGSGSAVECLIANFKADTDLHAEIVKDLDDGRIDADEAARVAVLIAKKRERLDRLEQVIFAKRGEGEE